MLKSHSASNLYAVLLDLDGNYNYHQSTVLTVQMTKQQVTIINNNFKNYRM